MNGSGDDVDTSQVTWVPDVSQSGAGAGPTGARLVVKQAEHAALETTPRESILDVRDVSVYYGDFRAIQGVTLRISRNEITALIGPSGCGKTTFIRCLNRMNDLNG